MRKIDFIIFFSIVLLVYGLINYYIFIRGWQAVPPEAGTVYIILFTLLSWSYFIGRFGERVAVSWLTDAFVWVGAIWLGMMVYLLLFVIAIDVVRMINHFLPFFPSFITSDIQRAKAITFFSVLALTGVIVVGAYINARTPRIRSIQLDIPKVAPSIPSLNIVAASDIHLGTIICQGRLEKIVDKINALDPDIILFPGDVIDEDLAPVIRQNLGETLRKLKSKYGVFSITGNHEYIGGVEQAVTYLRDHGITVLRDSSIKIADAFYLIGREDISGNRFRGAKRKPLEELVAATDKRLPLIMMDHQPFRLHEAESNGIDLQLSGHTHHGQLWPFNFITKKVYELSWGYLKKGNTHYYVSSGVGTWGPPMRTGNSPEIINIRVRFQL